MVNWPNQIAVIHHIKTDKLNEHACKESRSENVKPKSDENRRIFMQNENREQN